MTPPRKPRKNCLSCGKKVKRAADLYCSNSCLQDRIYKDYINRWKAGEESGNIRRSKDSISAHVRRYMFEKYGSRCSRCGWAEVNPSTKKIPLTIEHMDGDWSNTAEENIDLICPNCHSLTPTYGAGNKGRGRPYRQFLREV